MRRIITIGLTLLVLLGLTVPASAGNPVLVYYAGPQEGGVYTALTIAPKGTFTFVSDPAQADVFVLNGTIPAGIDIASHLKAGAGLVLFLGPDIDAEDVVSLTGIPLSLTDQTEAVSLIPIKIEDPARHGDHLERLPAGA